VKIFNIGAGELIFILLLIVIIFGPRNMVKTARDAGAFLRKLTKSPYWKEVWATRRELEEIPRMIAKEAQLDETLREMNRETRNLTSSVKGAVSDLIRETDQPAQDPHTGEVTWERKGDDTGEPPKADGI